MQTRVFVSKVVASFIPVKSWSTDVNNFIRYSDAFFWRRMFCDRVPYKYIVSIGSNCFSANALRLAGLRSFATPFDWVAGGDIDTRIKYLDAEFKDFVVKDDFEFVTPGVYKNNRTGLTHPHDFSKGGDFDREFTECAVKYNRRAARFIKTLKTGEPMLLVYTGAKTDIADIQRLIDMLNSRFSAKCDVLFFETGANVRRCHPRRVAPNIWHGIVPAFDGWNDKKRKIGTRIALSALAQFRLAK